MTASARPKPTTIRLEAGTPITGTVKFVDWYPERENPKEPGKTFSAQWAFTGDFDGQLGKVYIDTYQLEENPLVLGLVGENGKWPDGNPKFKWTGTGPVTFSKYLKDKKAHVRITPAGAAKQFFQGTDLLPNPTPSTSAPAATPIAQWWQDQYGLMKHCVNMAREIHGDDKTGMTETAHSLFIQANREGKLPPPSAQQQAEAIRATFDALPEALQDGPPDPQLPAWMQ